MSVLNLSPELLTLTWDDNTSSAFHAIWLRDNCRCNECGEPSIGRRSLRLSSLDLEITLLDARVEQTNGEDRIRVAWSDGHSGIFTADWLRQNSYDDGSRLARVFKPTLWSEQFRANPPTMEFEEVMEDENRFLDLLHTVKQFGLCFVKNSPAEPGTGESLASKIGFIQESNFGRVMDLVADKRHRSIANDADALKPHTDEPYRASPPGILLFHCVETDESGKGASTFLDGFEVAETLKAEDPDGFRAISKHNQGFRRFFDEDVDLIAEFPVISTNEFGNVTGVRINDRVASPTCIDPEAIGDFYRGMKRFLQLAEDENRILEKVLKPGDIAVFDNHRVLHGRTRLQFKGRRWLQWVQVERGDFHSTMRILADRLGRNRDAMPLLRGAYG